ncbi:MAG TPA: hypothetical protein DDW49_01405 [Deltaproteobacteria bacterium]|nr:MAG: hypothetical protein A2048_06455 [Deltaproteobacteria bacterium GWA2_45_12]HBF12040.1 hypothetical protein [Deltaproteobacteria bacterium]
MKKFNQKVGVLALALSLVMPLVGMANGSSSSSSEDPNTFRVFWKEGVNFQTADKKFKFKIGGRLHTDVAYNNADQELIDDLGPLNLDSGAEIRRARIELGGLFYERFEFQGEFDFANAGGVEFRDYLYLGVADIPVVGGIRVGYMKEPFGLNEYISSNANTFMEVANACTFCIGGNLGFQIHNDPLDGRMSWQAGVFKDTDNRGRLEEGGNIDLTGRITGLPWYEDDGEKLVHLGLSYSFQNYADHATSFARAENGITGNYVNTGSIAAANAHLIGTEFALVYKPFSFQGEYINAFVNADGTGVQNPNFNGFYAEASYILTGEHRDYKKGNGVFGSVKPKNNFLNGEGGLGAWQLAARYSRVDLNDESVLGGILTDYTAGVNWYLNPNVRVMVNYGFADLKNSGHSNSVMTRFQINI